MPPAKAASIIAMAVSPSHCVQAAESVADSLSLWVAPAIFLDMPILAASPHAKVVDHVGRSAGAPPFPMMDWLSAHDAWLSQYEAVPMPAELVFAVQFGIAFGVAKSDPRESFLAH